MTVEGDSSGSGGRSGSKTQEEDNKTKSNNNQQQNPQPSTSGQSRDDVGKQLIDAAQNQDITKIQTLAKQRNFDPNYEAYGKDTALHKCVKYSKRTKRVENALKCVTFLVETGGSVDAEDGEGKTPLHWAVLYNDEKMIKQLIKHGADVLKEDSQGYHSISLAIRHDQDLSLRALSENKRVSLV